MNDIRGEVQCAGRAFWLDVTKVSLVAPANDNEARSILVVEGKVIESAADPVEIVAYIEHARGPRPPRLSELRPLPVALLGDDVPEELRAIRPYIRVAQRYQMGEEFAEALIAEGIMPAS